MAGTLLLLLSGSAQAGTLDECRVLPPTQDRTFRVGDADLGLDLEIQAETKRTVIGNDTVRMAETDFHPETDRWTEKNNRIRISFWSGVWMFSNELDVHHDVVIGIRLNWEVPGFISIRLDSGAVPWSRMEVKGATAANPRSSRWMSGVVHNHNLSLGIFNPELSVAPGLAFWAGFGLGLWFFDYQENDVFNDGTGVDAQFDNYDDLTISGNIFVELDYEIMDIFHIGLHLRQHIVLAGFTDEGRYYEFNGVEQSGGDGRNDGQFDDLAGVTEVTITISVLF